MATPIIVQRTLFGGVSLLSEVVSPQINAIVKFYRRDFLAASLATMASTGALPLASPLSPLMAKAPAGQFSAAMLDGMARALAGKPYAPPSRALPQGLAGLSYDEYRMLRLDRSRGRLAKRPILVEPMLRGGPLFLDRVELDLVEEGESRPLHFDPSALRTRPPDVEIPDDPELGFSGVRFLGPIRHQDQLDEIAVFQGASYFRAVGAANLYGLSARGLAIDIEGPEEEFPVFRHFFIEMPEGADMFRVHALLDGPSVAGAFHFTIKPGDSTVMDVDARIYPRKTLTSVGIAPMSSMFMSGPAAMRRFDDFRPAVHDSEGVAIWNGAGERLWRPLGNPREITSSAFEDDSPRGFGLMQRARDFADFQDAEADYHLRPSLWVEPLSPWGRGSVRLLELPSDNETTDNIVLFWQPKTALEPGAEHRFSYRLYWGDDGPTPVSGYAIIATRTGARFAGSHPDGTRQYMVVFDGPWTDGLSVDVEASAGKVHDPIVEELPDGKVRAAFGFQPPVSGAADLRLTLKRNGKPMGERWLMRWPL